MSDHKSNPEAVFQHMMPPALPPGCIATGIMAVKVVPAAGVVPYPADRMRKIEGRKGEAPSDSQGAPVADEPDRFEYQEFGSDEWKAAPEGVRVMHPIGQPLPPELCDVVIMVGTLVQDALAPGLVTMPGRAATPKSSTLMQAELGRMPLIAWQEHHMRQLRGPVT